MTNRDIINNLGTPADSGMIIDFATDGISTPVSIIEVAYKFMSNDFENHCFLKVNESSNHRDLVNSAHTNIIKSDYEREAVDINSFLHDILGSMDKLDVHYLVINNKYWYDRITKENPLLNPLLNLSKNLPTVALIDYERARLGNNWILSDGYAESFYDVCKCINSNAKSAPRTFKADLQRSYIERTSDDTTDSTLTFAQRNVKQLSKIWDTILDNTIEEERYWGKEE